VIVDDRMTPRLVSRGLVYLYRHAAAREGLAGARR
jgi:hypothetical protein